MTFTPEMASVNAVTQLGVESNSALGTPVAANKILSALTFKWGMKVDVKTYQGSGQKYVNEAELNKEWTEGSADGPMDFNSFPYLMASAWGAIAPAASGASTTAKDWVGTPPTSGAVVPQTYTFEQGDAQRAHKMAYGIVTKLGYKITRDEATVSADLLARQITDAITLTTSPTEVAIAPMAGGMFNIYIDPTSGALGTTQYPAFLSAEYEMSGIYGPTWFINRANASFTDHVDMAPKTTMKILLRADAQGMGLRTTMQAGATGFMRVEAIGSEIDGAHSINNSFIHDLAFKVTDVDDWADQDGLFAIGWTLTIANDATWGNAQTATCTNLITAL